MLYTRLLWLPSVIVGSLTLLTKEKIINSITKSKKDSAFFVKFRESRTYHEPSDVEYPEGDVGEPEGHVEEDHYEEGVGGLPRPLAPLLLPRL